MTTVNVVWFGWFQDPAKNSDKVWGWLEIEGNHYNFWARRGKKMQFKQHDSDAGVQTKINAKWNKGYNEVQGDDIENAWPDFMKTVRGQLFTAKMCDKVR